ncbi:MAG TPA: hypothetical protein DIU15_03395 [Deltaproteobacteria bacterium]|nr:hypothetical protein [Deltaproteobacteria bacterium]HCP45057.1 hypothetical protein [Deltaproteobacteria bacterium]
MSRLLMRGLLALLVLIMSGCFRRLPYFMLDLEEELPLTPAVARWFTELDEARYPELQLDSRPGVPLDEFLFRHEVEAFTQERTRWGAEPGVALLLFADTNHPETYRGAEAAWFLASDPTDGVEWVRAVLFRDFSDAPTASDPVQLVISLAPAFSGPWTLCQPWSAEESDFLVSHGPRGVKLGLVRSRHDPDSWTVDHVEFVARSIAMSSWIQEKGYGGCTVQGTIDASGRYQEAGSRRVSDRGPLVVKE